MAKSFPLKTDGDLLEEITEALKEIGGWGSLEVYIQNFKVTQITRRKIKKTDHSLGTGA